MTEHTHRNSLKPGYKIHWYEIKRILGQGGFGITYLAHDLNLDKDVAIKEYLPTEFAVREGDHSVHPISSNSQSQYKWGLDRFIAEARTLSKFEHPNIVRVFAVFEENNTGYMVMAYEHGQSLQTMLAGKKTLEEAVLLKILVPILGGLEKIHNAGFIHRDIKPDNIYIREDGSPVLLDFGSARQALAGQTKTLTSLVSPGYAPFEQYYSKSDEQGPWSDIYGLGATLYRAVSGRAPMDAVDRSKSMLEGTKDTIVTAEEIGRGLYSERFLKAIDHAIKFKPKDRPQSITEWKREFGFKDNLAEFERFLKLESQPTRPGTRIGADKTSRFRPVMLLVFVILVSVTGIFYFRNTFKDLLTDISPVQESTESKALEQQLTERERLKEEVHKLAEEKQKMEEERKLADEKIKQEAAARLAEQERQKQQEEQKRLEEERKLAEEKIKQEAAARLAEQERQKQQEEQKRLEEQTRFAEERKKLEEEKQKFEEDMKKQEEARLAEQERQKQMDEQKQLEEQKQLAEETKKQEETAQLVEQEKQQMIEQSRVERQKRSAKRLDSFGYVDDLVAQDLLQLGEKQKQISVVANIDKWQNSGVLIKKGNTYKITATGQWSLGGLCNPTGPDGEGIYSATCWDLGGQTVAGYTHSSLIGKIGSGNTAFYVGREYRFTSEEEGVLYFMSNDAPAFFFDNSGSFSVNISVE